MLVGGRNVPIRCVPRAGTRTAKCVSRNGELGELDGMDGMGCMFLAWRVKSVGDGAVDAISGRFST